MNTKCAGTITAAISAMLLGAAPATAQEIYRWVDANGVVNFSDTAPAAESSGVSTVVIEDTQPADYHPEVDLYDVAGQAERMQALREQMARERDARREREKTVTRTEPSSFDRPVQYGYRYGYPIYPRPPMRPPLRSPARPPTGSQPPSPEPYEASTLRPPGKAADSGRP